MGMSPIEGKPLPAQFKPVLTWKARLISLRNFPAGQGISYGSKYITSKEERIGAILEPRYDNLQIYHYKGGHCQTLEEELIMARPPHDDIKDALASAVDIAIPPKKTYFSNQKSNIIYHSRFGGVAH